MPGASPLGRVVDRRPGRKNVLAWIDSRSLMQSHAAAVIERMGHDTGLYDTFIRADARAALDVERAGATGGLDKFDAIFFLGSRDDDLGEAQRGLERLGEPLRQIYARAKIVLHDQQELAEHEDGAKG